MNSLYDAPVYSPRLKRRMAAAEEVVVLAQKALFDGTRENLIALSDAVNGYSTVVSYWRNDVDGDLSL